MSDICQPPERPTGPPEPELRRNDKLRHWIEATIGKEMTRRSMLMEEAVFEAWYADKGVRVLEGIQSFEVEVTDEVPAGQIHYVRSEE